MIYLLDANAISDLIVRPPRVEARLATVRSPDSVRLLTIVEGEVLFGVERLPPGAKRQNLDLLTTRVMSGLVREPLPIDAARHFAMMKADCQRRGVVLGENDVWIAAAAIALSATVVTRDRDFTRVPGLPVEDWSQ